MPELADRRQVSGYSCTLYCPEKFKISILNKVGFTYSFRYDVNPTGNCQLSSAIGINNVLSILDKYTFRDLLIKIRREHFSKRILMIDINKCYFKKIKEWLAPSVIMKEIEYVSTNGSHMVVMFLKLSNVRQLQLPR